MFPSSLRTKEGMRYEWSRPYAHHTTHTSGYDTREVPEKFNCHEPRNEIQKEIGEIKTK